MCTVCPLARRHKLTNSHRTINICFYIYEYTNLVLLCFFNRQDVLLFYFSCTFIMRYNKNYPHNLDS